MILGKPIKNSICNSVWDSIRCPTYNLLNDSVNSSIWYTVDDSIHNSTNIIIINEIR